MKEKRLFCRETVICDDGKKARLYYYLLKKQRGYGVMVEMRRKGEMEKAAIPNVTPSPEKITEVLLRLSRNTVTPCALHEIIAETKNNF